MKKWEELTSDELNLLEVLYWVGMFPNEEQLTNASNQKKRMKNGYGKSISLDDLYIQHSFNTRMNEVNAQILKRESQDIVPTWPYEPTRMKYDKSTGVNPLRSMLNHLSMDGYLEVSEELSSESALRNIQSPQDKLKYDFKKIDNTEQSKIYVQICRAGLVVAEQWIAHRKKLADQKAELAAQNAETEASKRLERTIGVMGGLAVVVAMLEWNWNEANIWMSIARVIMILVMVTLILAHRDAISALFGHEKHKNTDENA